MKISPSHPFRPNCRVQRERTQLFVDGHNGCLLLAREWRENELPCRGEPGQSYYARAVGGARAALRMCGQARPAPPLSRPSCSLKRFPPVFAGAEAMGGVMGLSCRGRRGEASRAARPHVWWSSLGFNVSGGGEELDVMSTKPDTGWPQESQGKVRVFKFGQRLQGDDIV